MPAGRKTAFQAVPARGHLARRVRADRLEARRPRLKARPRSLCELRYGARMPDFQSRPYSFDVQSYSIKPAPRAEIERLSVCIAPGEVMRVLRTNDGTKVLPFRGKNPETARTRDIQIASPIDLHPIQRVLTRRAGHVEKDGAVRQ